MIVGGTGLGDLTSVLIISTIWAALPRPRRRRFLCELSTFIRGRECTVLSSRRCMVWNGIADLVRERSGGYDDSIEPWADMTTLPLTHTDV